MLRTMKVISVIPVHTLTVYTNTRMDYFRCLYINVRSDDGQHTNVMTACNMASLRDNRFSLRQFIISIKVLQKQIIPIELDV
ncbi:hypothetical protein Bhyg_10609, partial [Pseudolycoriella hygida]